MNHSTTSPAEPPSSRLGRAARRVVIAVLTVVLVAGPILLGPLMMKACEEPADHTYRQKPSVSSEPLTLTGSPWEVCLPNGAIVELIGLAESPSGGKDWWAPDGLPLAERPYDRPASDAFGGQTWESRKAVEVAFRTRVPNPEQGSATMYSVSPNSGSGSVVPLDRRGEDLYSLTAEAVLVPKDQETVTVRVGAAAGEWKTAVRGTLDSGGTMQNITRDEGYGFFQQIFPPNAPPDSVISVLMDLSWDHFNWQFIAVDASGKVHRLNGGNLTVVREEGKPPRRRVDFTVSPSDKIGLWLRNAELRLDIRPFHYAEFQNVSLQPGKKTDVRIVTGIRGKPEP